MQQKWDPWDELCVYSEKTPSLNAVEDLTPRPGRRQFVRYISSAHESPLPEANDGTDVFHQCYTKNLLLWYMVPIFIILYLQHYS